MRCPTRCRWLPALLAAAMLTACGDKKTPAHRAPGDGGNSKPPAGGPAKLSADAHAAREAALAFIRAQVDGDGRALAHLTDVPPSAKAYVADLAPTAASMCRFHQAGVKAYGKPAWLAAQPAGQQTIPPMPAEAKAEGRIGLTPTGAEFSVPGSEALVLVKRQGRWLVRPPMPIPDSPEERRTALTNQLRVATALRGVAALIGKEGTTAHDVMTAANRAVKAALLVE